MATIFFSLFPFVEIEMVNCGERQISEPLAPLHLSPNFYRFRCLSTFSILLGDSFSNSISIGSSGETDIQAPLRCIPRPTFLDSGVWAPFSILSWDFCCSPIFIGNCGERQISKRCIPRPTFLHSGVWSALSRQHQFQIQLVSSHKLALLPWIFLLQTMSTETLVVFVLRQKRLEGALEAGNDHWVGPNHPLSLFFSFSTTCTSSYIFVPNYISMICSTQWAENIRILIENHKYWAKSNTPQHTSAYFVKLVLRVTWCYIHLQLPVSSFICPILSTSHGRLIDRGGHMRRSHAGNMCDPYTTLEILWYYRNMCDSHTSLEVLNYSRNTIEICVTPMQLFGRFQLRRAVLRCRPAVTRSLL